MNIVILGKGAMLANLIEGTLLSSNNIVGVFRYERLYHSNIDIILGDNFKSSPVVTLIRKNKLKDIKLKTANCQEFKDYLIENQTDIVLVGTWPEKLKKEIINTPKIATINVHPSLLPKYRGPNPYLQTIWRQEKYSGLTFHLMTENLDGGPILAQMEIPILKSDTGKELKIRTTTNAKWLCKELLEKLSEGAIEPTPQNEEEATYYKEIDAKDMTLNFRRETRDEIYAHIRAFSPFRPTYIQDGDNFWITDPYNVEFSNETAEPYTIVKRSKRSIVISCNDKKCICLKNLKKYTRLKIF